MSCKENFVKLREIYNATESEGLVNTYLENVRFFWVTDPVPRTPVLCNAGIVILGQGSKIGYLNGKGFQYDEDRYLIVSVPIAFECETHASKEKPLVGIFIDIDIAKLHQLIEKVEKYCHRCSSKSSDIFCGVEPIEMDSLLQKATENLILCLQSPLDSDVLGQAFVDEIMYRALLGNHGKALVALTRQETQYARIAQSLSYIHSNYMNHISVDDLAEKASMSVSSFYRAFKFVTGDSPLQYLKKTRLHNARSILIREKLSVSIVASRVGYESTSQFSREFKRYFNVPPGSARN